MERDVDLVAKAKRQFSAKDDYWKNSLATNLENVRRGHSVRWAVGCLLCLTNDRHPNRMAERCQAINIAWHALTQGTARTNLAESALEIWHRPNRDGPQTAVSKLFTAVHQFHAGECCMSSSCAVISNLFPNEWPDGSQWHVNSTALFHLVVEVHDSVVRGDDAMLIEPS